MSVSKANVLNVLERNLFYFGYKLSRDEVPQSLKYFHTHRGIELLYVYEGNGHVILDDRFYKISPHTLLIFKPYQLHYIHIEIPPKYTCTLMKIKPTFIEQGSHFLPRCHEILSAFLNHYTGQQIFQLNDVQHDWLDSHFCHLFETLTASPPNLRDEVAILFLLQLFVLLVTNIMPSAEASPLIKPIRKTQLVNEMLKWIECHYKEQFTMDKLADELHFSASHMSKLFRQQTGKSIFEFVKETRLEQARILLSAQVLTVEEISEETGFNSTSYFIRSFKDKYGVSPHKYRLNSTNRQP